MELIKGLVIAIGVGLLGWKVINFLSNLNPIVSGLSLIVGGITGVVVALNDWIEKGYLTDQMLGVLLISITAIGAGLAIITGSWIPLLIAGVVGAVTTIIARWDSVKSAIKKGWDYIKNIFNTAYTFVKGKLSAIGDFFKNLGKNIGTGVTTLITNVGTKLRDFINKIRNGFAKFINFFIDGINALIDKLNGFGFDLPSILGGGHVGFNIKRLDRIPMLAEGGIVNRPTMAMIGEAGKEAVIPLENNTEFLDALGERLSQNVTLKFEGSLAQLAEILAPKLDEVSRRNGTRLRVQ